MNKRDFVRYESEFFPGSMSEATITWEGGAPVVSKVVNYSAHGIRVSIAPSLSPVDIPSKKGVVKVHMPIDLMWFTGMCVFADREKDGSVSMGIYFFKPEEQNYLKALIFKSLGAPKPADAFVSYEWEERIARLCNSADPKLKKIGEEKLKTMKMKKQNDLTPFLE